MAACLGCTSFSTTSLYRMANDSVRPQETNRKLKGIPVKLKVPSHLMVNIYEEQVILANSAKVTDELKKKATEAAEDVVKKRGELKKLTADVETARQTISKLRDAISDVESRIQAENNAPRETALIDLKKELNKQLTAALEQEIVAIGNQATTSDRQKALDDAIAAKEVAEQKAAVGYTLISFTPPQFHVESDLQYTDKVFLVDFKRPAGGILDLQGATMDDEQYFSEVKAEVTERTMEDIGAAMKTIEGVVPSLRSSAGMKAVPVSAETPKNEASTSVNFQKSVIATKRFDISECGWEERMQDFVNEHLGRPDLVGDQLPAIQPVNEPWQQSPNYGANTMEQGLSTSVPVENAAISVQPSKDAYFDGLVDVHVAQ